MSDTIDAIAFRLMAAGKATSAAEAQDKALDYLTAERAAEVAIQRYVQNLKDLMQMMPGPEREAVYRDLINEYARRMQSDYKLDPEIYPFREYTGERDRA